MVASNLHINRHLMYLHAAHSPVIKVWYSEASTKCIPVYF